nr:DNA primase [candidate division Zixibacteria bacterium]
MAGIIPQDIIEQVRQSSDIVDVLSQYIRLKKRGLNYLALCPFHDEKTASFSVSPHKQIYHCFGCGKGGNVFTFLMEHENMTFVEAVRHLAARAGITIPEKKVSSAYKEELERLHYAHQVALDYFRKTMRIERYRHQISRYLKETRKLTGQSIEFFQIGLAGEEWDGFLNYALKKELFPKELVKAGLVSYSEKNDKYYDRFRQRLMIPIFNLSDKPIAFGGRTLRKGEPAKYVNSPETILYSKSNVLYGLNFARQSIREKNEVIIVEGYFDLISLHQAGIKNVVASSGTAFTAAQARLLARFAEMACLFFDADSAGQTAAVRSVDVLYDAGMEVKVMVPPEGEDPDSVAVKSGADGIEKIREQALPYLEFRTRDIDLKKQGIIGKEKLIKELAELAGRLSDRTRRDIFITEAASILRVDPGSFFNLLAPALKQERPTTQIREPRKVNDFERDLLSLIINFPDFIDTVRGKLSSDDFQMTELGRLYAHILSAYETEGAVTVDTLVDLLEDKSLISDLTALANRDWNRDNAPTMIRDYLNQILYFRRERIIDRLKAELKAAEDDGDNETARRLAEEIANLIKSRKK